MKVFAIKDVVDKPQERLMFNITDFTPNAVSILDAAAKHLEIAANRNWKTEVTNVMDHLTGFLEYDLTFHDEDAQAYVIWVKTYHDAPAAEVSVYAIKNSDELVFVLDQLTPKFH